MGKTIKNKIKSKNLSKKKKVNLVYMAKPPWRLGIITAHLSKKYDYDLFKIGNKTETKREFGYG